MADHTKIEWADATVNTLYGCTKASPGCQNCYAIQQTRRLVNLGHTELCGLTTPPSMPATGWSGEVRVHPQAAERMAKVLRWQKPRVIFVNSMSDTFHADVPWDHIRDWFVTAALAPQHRFLFLTKRPENMANFLTDDVTQHCIEVEWERRAMAINWDKAKHLGLEDPERPGELRPFQWPLPNVWLGFTAEDQERFDQRWHGPMEDLGMEGWNLFVSCEPMLGFVDVTEALPSKTAPRLATLGWVIVGGESGPKARPMDPDWVRSIVYRCQDAGVPVMFKQWGEWAPQEGGYTSWPVEDAGKMTGPWTTVDSTDPKQRGQVTYHLNPATGSVSEPVLPGGKRLMSGKIMEMVKVGKRNAGRLIDGVEVLEWPEGMR